MLALWRCLSRVLAAPLGAQFAESSGRSALESRSAAAAASRSRGDVRKQHLFSPHENSHSSLSPNALFQLATHSPPIPFAVIFLSAYAHRFRLSAPSARSLFFARAIFLLFLAAAPLPSPCRRRHKELYIFFTRLRSSRPKSVTALLVHALPSPVLFLQLFPFARGRFLFSVSLGIFYFCSR